MKQRTGPLLLVALAAGLLTIGSGALLQCPNCAALEPLQRVVQLVFLLPLMAGLLVSGNVHQPNAKAFYVALFVVYGLIVALLWFASLALWLRIAKHRARLANQSSATIRP